MNANSELDYKTFRRFADLIYREAGIHLADHKQALVSARLGKRLRHLRMEGFEQYYEYVKNDSDNDELVNLLDAISTNVTYFFREPDHFELLGSIVSGWAGEGQKKFRLWCAAASTGEEPYSMAITLAETLEDLRDVKILATDISTSVLNKGRRGEYEEGKVERVSRSLLEKYFTKDGGKGAKHYRVKKQIREMISFAWLNLSAPPFPMRGPLDVIFCRNAMIYFDNTVRTRLLREMYRLLKPGGYLVVGHAESLSGLLEGFKSIRPSVYIKL